ncbi:MAG TPA: putative LPS assembly protein LptD [Longimicrobiaceae bacterium]
MAILVTAAGASAQVQVPADTAARRDTTAAPVPQVVPAAPVAGDTIPVPGATADTLAADTLAADTAGGERVPPPDPEADAIIAELRRLPGFVATEYLADSATYRTEEGVLRLIGQAQVEREGERINADSIIFRDQEGLVEAYGEPKVTGQAQELTGEVLYYDIATRRASALRAKTQVTQNATWFVTGDVTVQGTDRIYATDGHFTTCDLEIPHYHFEADRIKIVKDKYLVGRPARLYFGRVPVMVLPFFLQSLQQGRRSGFVVPRFSMTDIVRNSGHTREITNLGWYWAVNEYLGAELTGTWRSGAYTGLRGNVDFRWRRQFLDGNLGVERYWRQSGRRELALDSRASWRPDERTNLSGSGRFVTSSQFLRQSTIDPMEASQDLNSSFSLSRRFDWGTVATGATAQQSISDGGISYTLPSFSVSPNPITLFRDANSATASWYNNASLQWGFTGKRHGTADRSDFAQGAQDQLRNDLNGNVSLTVGRLNLSTSAQVNQNEFEEVIGYDSLGVEMGRLPGGNRDRGSWNASLGYQQDLIGQTTLTPSLGFSQEFRRDSLTSNEYLNAPTRVNFGASLSTAIFGMYGAIGPFSRVRHRISPTLSFTYSPAVQQNAVQDSAFGAIEGRTQNILTFGFNQTWEAKLKRPQRTEADDSATTVMDTTTAGDTLAARSAQDPVPQEPEQVTLLSINTSSLSYDFTRAAETGSGFTNTSINNSISSDYLRGLTVQISHDLFDRSAINPDSAEQRGELGRFAPRLSRLTTGFELGPNSAVFRWLGFRMGSRSAAQEGTMPGTEGRQPGMPGGSSTASGNPQSLGSGPWRTSIDYSFTRPPRTYNPGGLRDDRGIQTVNLNTSLPLTENWGVDWRTSYSLTDTEFSGHQLNFSRNLHRWQANFSFYQTATGNTGFQFFVELIDNRDLKFDYRESNLGIDR